MPLYTSLHNLLNVLVQIENEIGLQKETSHAWTCYIALQRCNCPVRLSLDTAASKVLTHQPLIQMSMEGQGRGEQRSWEENLRHCCSKDYLQPLIQMSMEGQGRGEQRSRRRTYVTAALRTTLGLNAGA
jgi:hypothetical protein